MSRVTKRAVLTKRAALTKRAVLTKRVVLTKCAALTERAATGFRSFRKHKCEVSTEGSLQVDTEAAERRQLLLYSIQRKTHE